MAINSWPHQSIATTLIFGPPPIVLTVWPSSTEARREKFSIDSIIPFSITYRILTPVGSLIPAAHSIGLLSYDSGRSEMCKISGRMLPLGRIGLSPLSGVEDDGSFRAPANRPGRLGWAESGRAVNPLKRRNCCNLRFVSLPPTDVANPGRQDKHISE